MNVVLAFHKLFLNLKYFFFKSLSRLLKYLDTNLIVFKKHLATQNFQKLLKSLWNRIIESFRTTMKADTKMVDLTS